MPIKQVVMGLIGLSAGGAVSAGVFAFLTSIGVITRIVGKTKTAKKIFLYENMIVLGGTTGCLVSVFNLPVHIGTWILVLFGISAGIYVGCLAMALAEVMNAFPIMFRRLNLKMGLKFVVLFAALGKFSGSLYFFANHMWK